MNFGSNLGLFVAYWPLTYYVSARVRPWTVGAWTLFYYFGVVRGTKAFNLGMLQNGLNSSAKPFLEKYSVKSEDYYAMMDQ